MRCSLFLFLCFGFALTAPSLDQISEPTLADDRVLLGDEISEEDGRLIDEDGKSITYSNGGDFTLLNIPISKSAASISFNDTQASTISALGNAALVVGGLYILSGFNGAVLGDPLGLKRRLSPAYPPMRISHKSSQMEIEDRPPVKRRRRTRPSRKQKHRNQKPEDNIAQERQQLRFRLPTLRPLRFRLPTLPALNFRPFNRQRRPSRPASRPAIASRPRPVRPAPDRPAPSIVESTPLAPVQQSSFTPQQSSFTPEQSSFTPQQSSFTPQQSSFTPQQSSFTPQQSSFTPQQSSFIPDIPEQSSFTSQQSSFTPQQSSFTPQQSSFTPQQSSFTPQQPSFTPQQSSFTPQQSSFRPDLQDLSPVREEFRTQNSPEQNFGFDNNFDNDFEIEEEEFRTQDNLRNPSQNFGNNFDNDFKIDQEFRTQGNLRNPNHNFGNNFENDFKIDQEFRTQGSLRNPNQNFGAAFDSPLHNDPFTEFQSQDFGDDAAFRTLLDTQFDDQFDFQKI